MLSPHRNTFLGSQFILPEVNLWQKCPKLPGKKYTLVQRCILSKYLSKKLEQFSFQGKQEKEQIPKNTGLKCPFLFKWWQHVTYKDCWVGATQPEELKCTPVWRLFKIMCPSISINYSLQLQRGSSEVRWAQWWQLHTQPHKADVKQAVTKALLFTEWLREQWTKQEVEGHD